MSAGTEMHRLRTRMLLRWEYTPRGSNLRSVKWGPRSGRWITQNTRLAAHGPPPDHFRPNMLCCWLCHQELQEHHRKWRRPTWTRRLRLRATVDPNGQKCYCRGSKTMPPSQLDMTIYCCPNGCDADDALQALLDQTDHTGPRHQPRPPRNYAYERWRRRLD